MAKTMPRAMRIPEDVWLASVAKAKAEGAAVTAVVRRRPAGSG